MPGRRRWDRCCRNTSDATGGRRTNRWRRQAYSARVARVTNYFDEPVAARYDDDLEDHFAPQHLDSESEFLAALAAPGNRALEFAIGTGRIAVPLARRGVQVAGIELSEPMLRRLRAKPESADMDVVLGDM